MSYTTKWYIVILLILMSLIGLIATGLIGIIWVADVTKLSFLIFTLFVLCSGKCGFDLFNYECKGIYHKRDLEIGWFSSEVLLSLGMMGTVIGFIIIMGDFVKVDVSNVSTIEALIKSLGSGVSTALYTTLVGLACSTLLKVQYFLFEESVERNEEV